MPVADEVTVAGTVVIFTLLNFIVIVEEGLKLAPVTVTVTPTGPWVGLSVIDGMTVYVATAVSAGTVPMSLPDTTTAYGPGVIDGTVNVHVKAPVAEIVLEVQV